MFDELSSRFEDAVKGLRGEAKISENNINDALKEVKKALLMLFSLIFASPLKPFTASSKRDESSSNIIKKKF